METQAKRAKIVVEEQKYHCKPCDLSISTRNWLEKHEKTAKHLRKSKEHLNPFICTPCNLGFHNKSNLTRHEKTDCHKKNNNANK